jgi:hypothetical protein
MAERMQGKKIHPEAANAMRKGPENGHSTAPPVKHKKQSEPPKPHGKGAPQGFKL